ncbi:uncharacterized protein LOC143217914 [Lasioglossum baleicum]|uniref:uncharacterized protein LOC143217914 n=1 Tax=Lasioglossum baleicum TaxID=434251 RepID=UPI003FCCA198
MPKLSKSRIIAIALLLDEEEAEKRRSRRRFWVHRSLNLRKTERLEMSAATCKKTWTSLRDGYRRALKRRKSTSGQAAVNIRRWKYEEEMAFLSRYYDDRHTLSSLKIGGGATGSTDGILERDSSELGADVASQGTSNSSHYEPYEPASPRPASPQRLPVATKKRRVEEPKSVAATVMDYLLSDEKDKETDEVELFCRCIGAKLRKLNPVTMTIVKKEIFSLLSDVQCRQLRGDSSPSSDEHLDTAT